MLVLSRNQGETIHAGGVVIHVVRVKGGRVRIGIQAEKEIKILRGELVDVPRGTDGGDSDSGSSD